MIPVLIGQHPSIPMELWLSASAIVGLFMLLLLIRYNRKHDWLR